MQAELALAGAKAAEEILRTAYRVDAEKALDPLDKRDFLLIVRRIARSLHGVSREAEAAALRKVLGELDVDWPNLSSSSRSEVIRAARQGLGKVAATVLLHIDQVFELEAPRVIERSKKAAARKFGLRIGPDLSRTDERIASFARESQAHFVRDEYGRRQEEASRRAREIIASGLEEGLSRDDIAAELSSQLSAIVLGRSPSYWEVVAMSFANRARSYTQLAAFDEAGAARYRFEAVLDEVTSEVCRFMHGQVFSVERAMRRFRDVERLRDPERIRDLQPWVQVGADDEGNQVLFYLRGGRRRLVAEVSESGVGERDAVGRYARELSSEELEAAGISVPPLHGRCRSTLVLTE